MGLLNRAARIKCSLFPLNYTRLSSYYYEKQRSTSDTLYYSCEIEEFLERHLRKRCTMRDKADRACYGVCIVNTVLMKDIDRQLPAVLAINSKRFYGSPPNFPLTK